MPTQEEIRRNVQDYRNDGYVVVRQLFTRAEATAMAEHYTKRRAEGPKPADMGGDPRIATDPLNKYPRMLGMQDWDESTKRWSSDPRILKWVESLIADEPQLNQTMLYFKPPGARGQGMHQDQQYITIDPLIGVWIALDDSDADNGQMTVVPGSHKLGLMKVEKADESVSFTGGQTELPADAREVGVTMKAGDALFFDGKTIHGSHPNKTKDRFRRSFICHFVGKHAKNFEPAPGTHMTHLK